MVKPPLSSYRVSTRSFDRTLNQNPAEHLPDQDALATNAHWLEADNVLHQLESSLQSGLTEATAIDRLQKYGENELTGGKGVSALNVLVRQMANALTLVLVAAMALSYGVQDWIEGAVITSVILLNIIVGFYQEYRAEKSMDSLRSLSSPTAVVVRGGDTKTIPAIHIVPGDICILKSGDVVPADLRMISVVNLEMDEALLTGETMPVTKTATALKPEIQIALSTVPSATSAETQHLSEVETGTVSSVGLPQEIAVGDRINLAFASSVVTRGRGIGVVVATAMKTQVGKIALAMQKKNSSSSKEKKIPMWKRFYEKTMELLGLRSGTPLQIKMSKFAYLLFGLAAVSAIIVFSVARFKVTNEVALYAIALGIGVIPESLIAVLTITMSAGTNRMAKSNVIVRQLHALEALGSITDICSDKTGTLTAGKMVVRKLWLPGHLSASSAAAPFNVPRSFTVESAGEVLEPVGSVFENEKALAVTAENLAKDKCLKALIYCASLCNVATNKNLEGKWTTAGDPTEIALQVLATKLDHGRSTLVSTSESVAPHNEKSTGGCFQLIQEYQFDSTIKRMTMVYLDINANHDGSPFVIYMKGAVERVLDTCTHFFSNEERIAITAAHKTALLLEMESLASQGLRVLALASRHITNFTPQCPRDEIEKDLAFIGLCGIYDPPRPESIRAIRACRDAGIVVHMLTGDHPATAIAIAREIGILGKDAPTSAVLPAAKFNAMTDAEVDALPALPLVIARCDPDTKVRMIQAGARRGRYFAMGGDGVNDAPSLKLAPVGIAMGSGSDVAKQASDLVLTDSNFDSIRVAISEGRRIFDNIQRFLLHMLATNVSEVVLLVVGLAFFDSTKTSVFPLSPLSILWINMITGGLPAFGLGLEPPAANVMTRPPQNLADGVFTKALITDTLVYGIASGTTCLMSFVIVIWGRYDGDLGFDCNQAHSEACEVVFRGRSTVFATLTLEILLYAWELKALNRSMFSIRPDRPFYIDLWENQLLFWSVVGGAAIVPLCIYVPGLNAEVFHQRAIDWEWSIVVGMVLIFVLAVEFWKMFVCRKREHA